jgi:hypothetical protein
MSRVSRPVTNIYENTNLTVNARIDKRDADAIREVTFKFLKDGEQFEEKTIPITAAATSGEQKIVSHVVTAPPVDIGKSSYFLDYYYFYTLRNSAGGAEALQNFPASKIQVFPRTAQLKVTDNDGNPFPGFPFMVEQNGEFSEVQKTFAANTVNAGGESIPAGSCEFNLGLFRDFRIAAVAPYQIIEEVAGSGRKREIKGAMGFRAVFLAPEKGAVKQYVNYEVENHGRSGIGHEVVILVGIHPDDQSFVPAGGSAVVYFRVTYGSNAPIAKNTHDDYDGAITLTDGSGTIGVALGKAGGDTCTVEISGCKRFLTDKTLSPDGTLHFENWRRVYYELLVPDLMRDRVLEPAQSGDGTVWMLQNVYTRKLESAGRLLFIEFVHAGARLFDAVKYADRGTLAPRRFLGLPGDPDEPIYILSGRNWLNAPEGQSWFEKHPNKTLYIHVCDALLKWRTGTDDEQAGTVDFSGTLTAATGFINMAAMFEGLFMPFSGYDGGPGIDDVNWTAAISRDDAVCKYTPAIEIVEDRRPAGISQELEVVLDPEELPYPSATVVFKRPRYPLDHDQHVYKAELGETEIQTIRTFVEALLSDKDLLWEAGAQVKVNVVCDQDSGHGEDDCFNAVINKLRELFDAAAKEFSYHPGLDAEGNPRTGKLSLRDITAPSTVQEWRFRLPAAGADGAVGPGSLAGAEKTTKKCPIKIQFAIQTHQASPGEARGRKIAWVCDASAGARYLVYLILQGLGIPGDCLKDSDALSADCIERGRSQDLTVV